MKQENKEEVKLYDGDYSSLLNRSCSPPPPDCVLSSSSIVLPPPAAATPSTPVAAIKTTTMTTPSSAVVADSYISFQDLFRLASLTQNSLVLTGAQIVASARPGCATQLPSISQVALMQSIGKANHEQVNQALVQRFLTMRGRHGDFAGSSSFSLSLLSPVKLVSSAASVVGSMFHNHAPEEASDETDRKVSMDDCLLNVSLTIQCVDLLARIIQKHTHEAQALYVVGSHEHSWKKWLHLTLEQHHGSAQQKELMALMQHLPLSQLDVLFRILEHDNVLERVVTASDQHPHIIVFADATGKADKDFCVTQLKLQSALSDLETAIVKTQQSHDECTMDAKLCKHKHQDDQAKQHLRRRKLYANRLTDLKNQQHTVISLLHNLENARHTPAIMQAFAATTKTLQQLRLKPFGETTASNESAEDILDDWADEMDHMKNIDEAFAAAAAIGSGIEALNDDDLLAELEAMPDPSGGDNNGGTVLVEEEPMTSDVALPDAPKEAEESAKLNELEEQLASLQVVDDAASQKPVTETEESTPVVA
ncbi:hypothetical protein MPSEU_000590500 [Mayamaea pseudoterrestris]|nr:hypothetical protein MPSEU_000590500 [Mayamaea pseudoterrestris]